MDESLLKPDIGVLLRRLEQRVRTLENVARVQHLNYLEVRNTSPELSGAGVNIDEVAILLGEDGWELPALNGYWTKANDSVVVTSGSFVGCYSIQFHTAVTNAFECRLACVTDPGTVGRVRIRNAVAGGAVTDEIVLPSGSADYHLFGWLHQQPIGTGPFWPTIEARRVSGAGNVYIFAPESGRQVGARWISATPGGVVF